MNARILPAPRRARLGGVIASLAIVTWALAGCSASADSADAGAEPAYYEGGDAVAEANFAEAPAVEGLTTSESDRSVVVTGSMYMTVEDPIASADQAVSIVKTSGGRVDARNETAPDGSDGGSAWLTLRIPSGDLDAVVDDIGALGTVDQFSTSSTDVTNTVTDLEAQISTLRASTARIEALLVDAKGISDIIKLEAELDSRQSELESLEARQRGLNDQVSMSTIDLSLTTEPVVIVDDSPKNFWSGLQAGWNGLVAFVSVALVVLGVLLPWLIILGVITLAIVLPLRSRKARKPREVPSPLPPVAAAAPAPQAPPAEPTTAQEDEAPSN